MTREDIDTVPLEEPLAEIERSLMAAYVAGLGQDLDALRRRTDDAAHTLLAEASRYASGRLSEIEARSHYLQALRGTA
ncbi:MAG TPA: hypothetical protein VMW48_02800 [Vicinamibacterales bacterium]|nr:hypothetical protein [Vicinamibacterales bacterium]